MTKFFGLLLLGLATTAFSHTKIETIDLESCVVDQPFDDSRVNLYNSYGTNGHAWYLASYVHYYQNVKKQLVIVVTEAGQVSEREILVRSNHTERFESVANYHEGAAANNWDTQKKRLLASIDRYLRGRSAIQCP